ncbi:MAG: hypothetical protein BWY09_02768 [Candidatus Hydrogenedentes bacterium ADurb.Bin179]|nr:MAG: hypothetical protein BWY09_02768 [Candidatus Hydrogenedentes bacterium ADurb.Bin179]
MLDTLQVLVIPDAQVLDSAWVEDTLTPWLERGGRLVYTGDCGLYRGEGNNFNRNEEGSCLAALHDQPRVAYIAENLGRVYYLLDTLEARDALRPRFSGVILKVWGEPAGTVPPIAVPATVGMNLYEDQARGRLFVDLNNMNLNPETDTIQSASDLIFSARIPGWMAEGEVYGEVYAPDGSPAVQLTRMDAATLEVRLDTLRTYAGIVLTARP